MVYGHRPIIVGPKIVQPVDVGPLRVGQMVQSAQ